MSRCRCAILRASAAFYERLLAPLGYRKLVERPASDRVRQEISRALAQPARRHGAPRPPIPARTSPCARASEDAVRAFHAAALAGGGASDGEPGPRQAAMTTYFGAFILDPDGNKLEAVSFPAA